MKKKRRVKTFIYFLLLFLLFPYFKRIYFFINISFVKKYL